MIKIRAHTLIYFLCSLLAAAAAPPCQALDSEHKKHEQKAVRLSGPERMEQIRAEADERYKEQLKKAIERLDKVKETKGKDPQAYFTAMVDVAQSYRTLQETEKADKIFDQAESFYKEHPAELREVNSNRSFWRYVISRTNDDRLDQRFLDVLKLAEKYPPAQISTLDSTIRDTFDSWRFDRGRAENKKEALGTILSVRESVRGKEDASLVPLIKWYAEACEGCRDVDEAEKAFLRADGLDQDRDPQTKAIHMLNIAEFYLRHGMYEKADFSWHKADQLAHDGVSEMVARSFLYLCNAYARLGRQKDMDSVITAMLADGGDPVLNQFDPKLTDMVNSYISSFSFDRAEDLIQKRIKAGEGTTGDTTAGEWRLRLSNLYLTTGKIADSKKIFDQLLAARALQGRSTDSMKERRAQLLETLGRKSEAAEMRVGIAPVTPSPLAIQYLFLAADDISLGRNTSVKLVDTTTQDPPLPTFGMPGGVDVGICSLGTLRRETNVLYGGAFYSGEGQAASPGISGGTSPVPVGAGGPGGPGGPSIAPAVNGPASLPAPRLSISPALKPPTTLNGDFSQPGGTKYGQLEPGDYLIDNQSHFTLSSTPGRRRIFLSDNGIGLSPFTLNQIGIGRHRPIDQQIWYDGTGKISVGGLSGVVYAPNATVTIPFNGEFTGAIVAARIICEGNNHITFDKSLLGVDLK